MRWLLVLALFATACTGVPGSGPHYESVRERLSEAPASFYVRADASSGTVTARRRGQSGWIDGTTTLAIEHGYVRAEIVDDDQLEIQQLEIAVAPIPLDGVFERPAHLQDVRLRLVEPVRADVAWTSVDAATATLVMAFDFDWRLGFDGEVFPLATQHLPPVNVDVILDGDGEHVGARLELEAKGELWNWADLVQINELSLSIAAETTD